MFELNFQNIEIVDALADPATSQDGDLLDAYSDAVTAVADRVGAPRSRINALSA